MCLDLLEELADAARKAADLKGQLEQFRSETKLGTFDEWSMKLNVAEAESVFVARVERAEKKLVELGWVIPPKRVAVGDREKELAAEGHTLPGTLPKEQQFVQEIPPAVVMNQ